jgi:hypothetical protein
MERWVAAGEPEYEQSLRALRLRNLSWKPSARCEQSVNAMYPKVPLATAKAVIVQHAIKRLEADKGLKRYRHFPEDHSPFEFQYGTKFKLGRFMVFMKWDIVDDSAIEPHIEVTSCHEDGK